MLVLLVGLTTLLLANLSNVASLRDNETKSVNERSSTLDLLYILPANADEEILNLNEQPTFGDKYKHGWILESDKELNLYLYLFYDGYDLERISPFLRNPNFMSDDYNAEASNLDSGEESIGHSEYDENEDNVSNQNRTSVIKNREKPGQRQSVATLYVVFTTDDNCEEAFKSSNWPVEIVEQYASNMFKARISNARLTYSSKPYYVCLQQFESDDNIHDASREFSHQGKDYYNSIITSRSLFPIWVRVVIFFMLLTLSGLFSGLNLGLMSLDLSELEILKKIGKPNEQSYAAKIYPLRKRGNFLLCTILLGNVLVNATSTLILGDMLSGVYAAIGSTLLIVIFGEIIPQAACSKHGLAVGAYTRYIMYLFMGITFPLSYPLSRILDYMLGKEIAAPYSREKIRELMKNVEDLGEKELKIISGALDFNQKKVEDIMTPIAKVFMLERDSRLDFETIAKISQEGYSRIPVYEETRENVVGILHVKDFTLLDPDDNMPVKALLDFYNHPTHSCTADTKIDVLFEKFRKGESHMAFVTDVVTDTDKDPYVRCIGIITLEDILEELVQMEIYDEFDDKKEIEKERLLSLVNKSNSELASSLDNLNEKLANKKAEAQRNEKSSEASMEVVKMTVSSASVNITNNEHKSSSFIIKPNIDQTELNSKKGPPTFYDSQTSHDLTFFLQQQKDSTQRTLISPQIRFVMFQFLFTTVKPMTNEFLTKNVLELIFKKAIFKESRRLDPKAPPEYLYEYGKGCNYFILILTGEATIEVGKEKLEFPAGPFAYFGVNALLCGCETAEEVLQEDFRPSTPSLVNKLTGGTSSAHSKQYVPDFSLRVDDRCVYMKLDRDLWRNGVVKSRFDKLNHQNSESIDLVSHDQMSHNEASINEANSHLSPKSSSHLTASSPNETLKNVRRTTLAATAYEKMERAKQHHSAASFSKWQTPQVKDEDEQSKLLISKKSSSDKHEEQPFLDKKP